MCMPPSENYGATDGRKLVRHLADNGLYIFSTEEAHAAARKLGIRNSYESVLMTSLVQGGWLQRLRRGLYGIADASLHPFAIATPACGSPPPSVIGRRSTTMALRNKSHNPSLP